MLTNLIENRGKEFTNLLKIGDYLGRTLRQNVELFSVEDGEVTYITESGHVVRGNYILKPDLKLSNIIVESSDVLEDQKVFEKVVQRKISGLLGNLLEDNYKSAEGSFDKILGMFETKLSYERVKKRLQEKTERFGEQTNIMGSDEFSRLEELKGKLVEHLKTNKKILADGAIRSGIKLSNLVSDSFDLPKMSLEDLEKAKTLRVTEGLKPSVYEYLCRKELVQKEILESKTSFDALWVDNEDIHDLASLVMESDEEAVRLQVATVLTKIPYFALATKKQLTSLIKNSLSLAEISNVSNKSVNDFVKNLYEMKKPVKSNVIKTLNEKYGIDVRKLDEVPTFRTLLMTEAEILKRIASTVDSKSVLHASLLEMASSLKIKNGTESIDLADFLSEVFEEAEYTEALNETNLMSYMDFSRVADDLGKIGQVLKMLSPLMNGGEGMGAGMPGQAPGMELPPNGNGLTPGEEIGAGEPPQPPVVDPTQQDPMKDPMQDPMQDPLGSPDPMDPDSENPGMESGPDAQDVADEVLGDGLPGEEEGIPGEEDGIPGEEEGFDEFGDEEEEDMEPEEMGEDDMTSKLTQIQDLLSSILGDEEEDFGFGGEDDGEEFEEDGEEFEEEGEFEDSDEDEDEESEEEFDPKKKKGKSPKPFK